MGQNYIGVFSWCQFLGRLFESSVHVVVVFCCCFFFFFFFGVVVVFVNLDTSAVANRDVNQICSEMRK